MTDIDNIKSYIRLNPLWAISILFFAFRLPYITSVPIFNDEAIFLDWANRIISGRVSAFYSLYDGTPPGLIWIFGFFSKLISDPLIAGRLVAVSAGYLTLLGLYRISKKYISEEISLYVSLIFIVTPLFLFYNRQALMESGVSAVGVWSLFFSLNYFKKRKLKDVFLLGLILGVGLYIKASVAIFITTVLILFAIEFVKSKNDNEKNDLIIGFFALLGTIFALFLPLLFQKDFSQIFSGSNRYVLFDSELFSLPIKSWLSNIVSALEISFWHLLPTTFGILMFGIYSAIKEKTFNKRIVYFFLISFLQLIFLARIIHSRYLVSFIVLICVFSAYGLKILLSKNKGLIAYAVLVLPAFVSAFLILKPFEYLLLLSEVTNTSDLETYYHGFTSGYGIEDVRKFLELKSIETPILAGVRLDSGNPESAIFAYYGPGKDKRIEAIYFDSKIVEIPADLNYINSPKPIYFISRGENLAGMEKYLKEEMRFYKPNNTDFIGVYSLKKEGE